MLKELLTSECRLVDTLGLKLSYNLCLGSDRCVVGTWYPAGILALHTRTTHQYILQSVVKHVTHMQHTCYIWWRNNDCVWLTSIRL